METQAKSSLCLGLRLILSSGVPRRHLPELFAAAVRDELSAAMPRREMELWICDRLPAKSRKAGLIQCPTKSGIVDVAKKLAERSIEIVWRGSSGFPVRLAEDISEASVPYLFLEGNPERLSEAQCAMIGTRQLPEFLHGPAVQLARALSDRGVVVTSGLAKGSDQAAHEGAMQGAAGTIALPAMGLLKMTAEVVDCARAGRMTLIGLDAPGENFTSQLAIRRDHAIAALADDLFLIASGLAGGSAHAVNWALEHGRRIWCFEAGDKTPDGNASLLNSGRARPLCIDRPTEELADEILRAHKHAPQRIAESQLDWITT